MSWIKLHREVLDSQVFSHPTTFKIWCWLLIKANHKKKFVSMQTGRGFTEISVERGQFVFGRHKAETSLDIDGSTIYKHIQKLQDWGNIKIESNNQFSIITICKYDEYQTNEGEEEQPSNNKVTTKEQPSNSEVTQTRIPKNDKNEEEQTTALETFIELKQMAVELENGFSILEAAAKKFKTNPDSIKSMIPDFIATCTIKGKENDSIKEYRNYFSNWLDLQFSKKKQIEPIKNYASPKLFVPKCKS